MHSKRFLRAAMAAAMIAGTAMSASATSLIRMSLEELTASNQTVVVGEVLDAFSYWNNDKTFILTDVYVRPIDVVKGDVWGDEITITLMGGSVGDLTTLIVGGATLVPGRSYVLFLNEEDLPGVERALTVRDHIQGAFDLVLVNDEVRAISQATDHPLLSDKFGLSEAAGGLVGLPLDGLLDAVREISGAPRR